MTKEQRAEALMAKGPIQNVRRIMELEDAVAVFRATSQIKTKAQINFRRDVRKKR